MNIQNWLPTVIATGALGGFWFLIRSHLNNLKADRKEEIQKVNQEIETIKDIYMAEEKHELLCSKRALEIEKVFKGCMDKMKDAIFEKLREFEKKLK